MQKCVVRSILSFLNISVKASRLSLLLFLASTLSFSENMISLVGLMHPMFSGSSRLYYSVPLTVNTGLPELLFMFHPRQSLAPTRARPPRRWSLISQSAFSLCGRWWCGEGTLQSNLQSFLSMSNISGGRILMSNYVEFCWVIRQGFSYFPIRFLCLQTFAFIHCFLPICWGLSILKPIQIVMCFL